MELKDRIVRTAHAMAKEIGAINITKEALCARVGIAVGSFQAEMGDVTFSDLIESLPADTVAVLDREVMRLRANPFLRKRLILSAALDLAVAQGYQNITREQIAEAAGVSPALVTRYFETMDSLRRSLMLEAIVRSVPAVIAQGIAVGDEIAKSASPALKKRAGEYILKS